MNKLKSLFLMLAMLVGMTAITSCSDEPTADTITEQSMLRCYASVTDMNVNQIAGSTICSPMTFKITLNWTKMTAQVDVNGLVINGRSQSTLHLNNLKWNVGSDGWSVIDVPTPEVTSASGIHEQVRAVKLRWLDRIDFAGVAGGYDPAFAFSFIYGDYSVVGGRNPFVLTGTTVSKAESVEDYSYDKSAVVTSLDFTKNLASMKIQDAHFASSMPPLDIEFKDMPCEVIGGVVYINCASLTPQIQGVPYSNFPITDVKAVITPGEGEKLEFKCGFKGTIYTVTADLYFDKYENLIL